MIIFTVAEVKSSTVLDILHKETSCSFFQESQFCTSTFENHFENSCLNGEKAVAYSKRVTGVKGSFAKGGVKGAYSVYQGFDKTTNAVKYVGITGRDVAVRFREHVASGTAKSTLRYEVIKGATGLTRTQARVWEQTLINQHGLNNLYNIRNSIAPKYWWQYGITP